MHGMWDVENSHRHYGIEKKLKNPITDPRNRPERTILLAWVAGHNTVFPLFGQPPLTKQTQTTLLH